jgi:adenylate kinase
LDFDPPRTPGICDRCQGELFQREDDREETIAARLEVYETQTAPLNDHYRKKGLLREIEGTGNAEDVEGRIFQVLGAGRK